MKIAIVILNWNGQKLLQQFLPSIINYNSHNAQIYVADNASSDNSIKYIQENFADVRIIRNTDNGGYAKGYNQALQYIEEDIYCLLNSDVEVTENWLNPVMSIFEKNKNVAIIQPKILDYKNISKFEYAGAAGGYVDMLGYPFCRGRIFDTLEVDKGQYDDVEDIFWASGACFFIRRKVFNSLGGFDEDYFAHQEEVDLCWRAYNEGYQSKYVGKSVVYHVGGATLNQGNPRKSYLNFRNSLLTLLKNLPTSYLFPIIFLRLTLDGVAGIKFLIDLKPLHTLAIIKAHFGFYARLPKFLAKRKQQVQKKNYYYRTSIVFDYFLKLKQTFRELG